MKDFGRLLWQIIDTIPTLAWAARPDGSGEFFNRCWLEYSGLSAKQALDWGWKVAIHPDDLPRMLQIFQDPRTPDSLSRWKADFAVSTENFVGFSSAAVLCGANREKSSSGTGRAPKLKIGRAPRIPYERASKSLRLIIDSIPGFIVTSYCGGCG